MRPGRRTQTPEVVFSGNRYPWLCGKRWRFRATATNGAGTSSVFTFGVTTEACKGPEGLTFKAFVPSGAAPITLDVQLNPPTQTFGLRECHRRALRVAWPASLGPCASGLRALTLAPTRALAPCPLCALAAAVTQYSVKLEHQGTAAEGLLTYTRDSATVRGRRTQLCGGCG